MDRSKALLIYGLCIAAPVLAGERPDGRDEGEVHANLPFTLSVVATAATASPTPTKVSFTAIASMEPKSPEKSASSINSKATSAAVVGSASIVVIPGRSSNLGPNTLQPVKYTGSPTVVTVASASDSSAKAPATTAAPSLSSSASKTIPYIDDWRTRMTWPPGCEEWANPCPQGAPLSGGGTARTLSNNYVPVGSQSGYSNPFTSLLTLTDENGVVTGMPAKATLPAGVTALPPWVTRSSSSSNAAAASATKSASTVVVVPVNSSKGAKASDAKASASGPVTSKNAASTLQMTGATLLVGLVGLVAAFL